jgi:VWFA-related protein
MASIHPQDEDLNVTITQVDNSSFPKVTVYVSVTNSAGEPVSINPSQLEIRENGKVIPFNDVETVGQVGPLTTLLVMDVSGSMEKGGKIESARTVAKEYINQMRDGDQAGIILFNTMVRTTQVIKGSKADLTSAVDLITPGGDTAMYDALLKAVEQLNSVTGRKAILVYTDGLDNRSTATAETVLSAIGKGGLTISTVGFGDASQELNSQGSLDEAALKKLAERSGGRYGYAENRDELSALYSSYGTSMRSEYELTYNSPSTLRNGLNRSLKVTIKGATQAAATTTYNPGGLIPEVPIKGSWGLFIGLLLFLGVLAAVPLLVPWLQDKMTKRKPAVKIKEAKKVAIRLKD